MKDTRSVLLATAAAALFASGQVVAAEEASVTEATVHCGGINACKVPPTINCRLSRWRHQDLTKGF